MTKPVVVKPDGTRVRLDTVWGQHWLSIKEAMALREDLDLALTQAERSIRYHAKRSSAPITPPEDR